MSIESKFLPIGGSGGIMKDMVSNKNVWGLRRLKTEGISPLETAIQDGLAYSIDGFFPSVAAGDSIAVNMEFASDVIIHEVVTNKDLLIKYMTGHATGVADGIFTPQNINRCSPDISPAEAQVYYSITENGSVLRRGYTSIQPFGVTCEFIDVCFVIENNTQTPLDIFFNIVYEETGPRDPLFGLTPTTFLEPTTEMSLYG